MAVSINKPAVIFIVDTSGSMYGQKIEAVNAAIAECTEVIRSRDKNNSLQMGYVTFDEKWGGIILKEEIGRETFKVRANGDGFYSLTSFQCLYQGLEKDLHSFGLQEPKLCLFLITDGKPVDSGGYTEALEQVKSMDIFRKAERYVALVGNDANGMDKEVLEFVGSKADRVIRLNNAASALSRVSFLSGFEGNASDTARYNSIFGD